ncbi:SPOR domain-containing protein [bacterium]|nr:SPOR domain-containing protein [bacterium]
MSQKTDNMIKLALVFFVSLLSFSIGTYVGKKYSDNQHKLALLEPKNQPPTEVTTKTDEFASDVAVDADPAHKATEEVMAANDGKPTALTDSEVAKIAEEFATEEDSTTEEKMVGTIETEEKTVGTIIDPEVTAKAQTAKAPVVQNTNSLPTKVAAITNPTTTVKNTEAAQAAALAKIKQMAAEERVPASIPVKKEVVTPLHFTVQVGSFPTQDEAEKMTKELSSKGYKTTFVPAKVNGQLWYRVNVGLFGSIKEAQDYKKEFLEKTKVSSAIVQRVQQ